MIAGVKVKLLVTEREGHAKEIIEQLPLEDLRHYDGAIAVRFGQPCLQNVCRQLLFEPVHASIGGYTNFDIKHGNWIEEFRLHSFALHAPLQSLPL